MVTLNRDAAHFYAERDNRTDLRQAQPVEPVNLAVTITPEWAGTRDGQLALYWLASLVSRMGQRFNRLQLWLPHPMSEAPCLIGGIEAPTLADAIKLHLSAADPFGSYPLVSRPAEGAYVVAVGGLLQGAPGTVVHPNGWAADLTGSGLPSSAAAGADGNPVGVALAASLAAGEVYRHFNSGSLNYDAQDPLWVSAWQSAATQNEAEAAEWVHGPSPAGVDAGRWLVVGAGALGGNVLEILGQVPGLRGHVAIVDPDVIEVSNLNRLLSAVLADRGAPKVLVGARSIARPGIESVSHVLSYEQLTKLPGPGRPAVESFDLVLTGVDQMATRALVQSAWPRVIVDAGTRGYSWRVSTHPVDTTGACVGCLAGKGQSNYRDLGAPLACAGGFAGPTPEQPLLMDSYGFVSFMAAAFQVAAALRTIIERPRTTAPWSAAATALNLVGLQQGSDPASDRCLCRCSRPVVRDYRLSKYSGGQD